MQQAEKLQGEQIRAFLKASPEVELEAEGQGGIYSSISRLLQANSYGQQSHGQQSRRQRGLLHRYLEKLTGLSRAQGTRLVGS